MDMRSKVAARYGQLLLAMDEMEATIEARDARIVELEKENERLKQCDQPLPAHQEMLVER